MFFRRKPVPKPVPETLPEKFARLLQVRADMIAAAPAQIAGLVRQGNVRLALENHSHLLLECSYVAVMQWRQGHDPRPAIRQTLQAYRAMLAERDRLDPDHAIPLEAIAGITDWDLVYALFWLVGEPVEPLLHHPHMQDERYFAYARYLLYRTTGRPVPDAVAALVTRFQASHDQFVDRNFRDLLALLAAEDEADAAALAGKIAASWGKRRRASFYNTSAPLQAGFDASNDLSVDYQLACIIHARGWSFTGSPHYWRWG